MEVMTEPLNFYVDGVDRFIVVTVATEDNDELNRFRDSCKRYNIPYQILGLGDEWKSGHAENGVLISQGGAQKVIYLRDFMKTLDNLQDTIVLFTDSYDVVFNAGPKEIIDKFRSMKSPVVFSTEKTCWPDDDMKGLYPETSSEYKYLNSGGFIGYGDHIFEIINKEIPIEEDDQRFYTDYFLNSGGEIPEKLPYDSIKPNEYESHSNGSPFGWMSETYFDDHIYRFVSNKWGEHATMLDIGGGDGKWAHVLGSFIRHIDCIEIFEPYVERYNLKEMYTNVYTGNFLDFDFEYYDLVVMGDVFEHVTQEEAFNWLSKVRNKVGDIMIVVPFEYVQDWDGVYENVYGHHHQPDLTPTNMLERYPMLELMAWTEQQSVSQEGSGFGWYVWKGTRNKMATNVKLDYNQEIFQTLNMSLDEMRVNNLEGKLYNNKKKVTPMVIHGNGPSEVKEYLKEIEDVVLGKNLFKKQIKEVTNRTVLISVLADRPVEDLNQVFDQIRYLDFPKEKIFINVLYSDLLHEYKIGKFIDEFSSEYMGIDMIYVDGNEVVLRDKALELAMRSHLDYTLLMDSNYIFRNRKSLQRLLGEDRYIITPMINSEGTEWVNFFFNVDEDGRFIDSDEQKAIKEYQIQDTFSVGYTAGMWLINNEIIIRIQNYFSKNIERWGVDNYDECFSYNLRERGFYLYLTNKSYYGGVI